MFIKNLNLDNSFLFKILFLFFLVLSSLFYFGFSQSEDTNESLSDVALKSFRDGVWDLAVKVYLFESVIFEPSKYFNLNLSDLGNDENNFSGLGQKSSVVLNVTDGGRWTSPISSNGNGGNSINFIPAQLFDISFVVSDTAIYGVSDILAIATFENFGTEEIPVDLTYSLISPTGEVLFSESSREVVLTQKSIFQEFDYDLELASGEYTLTLETVYGDNVRDLFEAKFSVLGSSNFFLSGFGLYLLAFLFFLFIMAIFILLYRFYVSHFQANKIENFENVSTGQNSFNLRGGNMNSNVSNKNVSANTLKKKGDDEFENIEGGDYLIEDDF